ncbi:MAG: amidase family protein [Pseudomonas sp.]|nr:amidase family protein [Pseudomonas sp.]
MNAPIIDRLEAAGAIIVGKTNMHELAYGSSGYNTAFHVPGVVGVRNAYDPNRIAGGSSSGSGSAVGARLVPVALGTDTGGSIRQPCALNGCVGLRPTVGRYSQAGIVPISPTRDTAGPMARSVEDVRLLDQVITGQAPHAPLAAGNIRLGVVAQFWEGLAPEVEQQSRAALGRLEKAGVTLVPVAMPGIHELDAKVGMPIALYEGRDALQTYLQTNHTGVELGALVAQISSPDVKTLFEHFIMPRKMPTPDGGIGELAQAYQWAIGKGRPQMIQAYQAVMQTHQLQALVFPTAPDVAMLSSPDATSFEAFARMIRNTDPGSNAGLPGISLPIGLAGQPGLPVGLEIDGLPHSDGQLLAIAQTLQDILGRQATSPAVH